MCIGKSINDVCVDYRILLQRKQVVGILVDMGQRRKKAT